MKIHKSWDSSANKVDVFLCGSLLVPVDDGLKLGEFKLVQCATKKLGRLNFKSSFKIPMPKSCL